ncbi:DUF3570 domain-containing protein [Flagellimonas sp. DF-77]|uniref:DUF3570 domain-containing protein n=1 Tax=Flagellimonas algarum TaxID=3230298 RepID=UPI0033978BBC
MQRLTILFVILPLLIQGQQTNTSYQKRVLEQGELDVLFSYYSQDGQNAAVSGGEGTEELTDATSTIVLRMPWGQDGILTVDAGVSAYTSASSSNVDPFDGGGTANPFDASSGASRKDLLAYFNPGYSHSSKDRNEIVGVNAYVSAEYDYFSIGFGGSYARLFNEKNTELSVSAQAYFDSWNAQYPIELRNGFNTGVVGYDPDFTRFADLGRNSYSLGFVFSQILTKRMQASLSLDLVVQNGLLSTPFQRVYFGDVADFFLEDFQLADDVERLPDSRFKIPLGGRLNYYLNDAVVLRSFYRFYYDDWGIVSHTLNMELPLKLSDSFTLYPSYRYYTQTAADYFYEKEAALSSFEFYTSDFDLSNYSANQFGFGLQYRDIFTRTKLLLFGLKAIDLRYAYYRRSNGLDASIITLGTSFVID